MDKRPSIWERIAGNLNGVNLVVVAATILLGSVGTFLVTTHNLLGPGPSASNPPSSTTVGASTASGSLSVTNLAVDSSQGYAVLHFTVFNGTPSADVLSKVRFALDTAATCENDGSELPKVAYDLRLPGDPTTMSFDVATPTGISLPAGAAPSETFTLGMVESDNRYCSLSGAVSIGFVDTRGEERFSNALPAGTFLIRPATLRCHSVACQ